MLVEIVATAAGHFTLAVDGDLDGETCAELREQGEKIIQEADCSTLRVDLRKVSFMDSSGLGALIAIRNSGDSAAVPVVFANPSPKVVTVLQVTRMIDIFTIEHDPT
jgi:anti-anti-sigma factor